MLMCSLQQLLLHPGIDNTCDIHQCVGRLSEDGILQVSLWNFTHMISAGPIRWVPPDNLNKASLNRPEAVHGVPTALRRVRLGFGSPSSVGASCSWPFLSLGSPLAMLSFIPGPLNQHDERERGQSLKSKSLMDRTNWSLPLIWESLY
jgi:hypothetical protein